MLSDFSISMLRATKVRGHWPLMVIPAFAFIIYVCYRSEHFYRGKNDHGYTLSQEENIRNRMFVDYEQGIAQLTQVVKLRKEKRLPDVIGIGFKKCGTGGVTRMISQHPMVKLSKPIELHYYDQKGHYEQGIKSYIEMLPEAYDFQTVMEKSPSYAIETDSLPERMHSDIPNVKIYVVICDPVNRTFSDFVHETLRGNVENGTNYDSFAKMKVAELSKKFSSFVNEDDVGQYILDQGKVDKLSKIMTTGIYYHHFRRWLRVYNRSQIMIIDGERLIEEPWNVVNELQDFIGLPRFIIKKDYLKDPVTGFYCVAKPKVIEKEGGIIVENGKSTCINSKVKGRTRLGSWSYQPSPTTIELVRRFYKSYNKKLFKMLGKRYNWQ